MTDESKSISEIREEVITRHYNSARQELINMVVAEPLKTTFRIKEGCVSESITKELCYRFQKEYPLTKVVRIGYSFMAQHYLEIEIPLSGNLIHSCIKDVSSENEIK